MELNISFKEFKDQVETQLNLGQDLVDQQATISNTEDLQLLTIKISEWTNTTANLVAQSFTPTDDEFVRDFKSTYRPRFNNISGPPKDLRSQTKKQVEDLQEKIKTLQYYVRLIAIADVFTEPAKVISEKRNQWTTLQVMELVLHKLYDLYDENYHSVAWILQYNGLNKEQSEVRDILKNLEQGGLVDNTYLREINTKLTLDGKIYVEQKRQAFKEDYSDLAGEAEMKERINEVLDKLNNVGLGQEIIFEELQELKELTGKLTKKTWGQLLKGKLLDLAIGKLVENDTISFIYQHITHHNLRLP